MQFHHVAGDTTQSETGLDALVNHTLTQILGHGERSTARTGLHREAVLKVTAVHHHLGSLLGEQDVARVLGVANGTRGNLARVTH